MRKILLPGLLFFISSINSYCATVTWDGGAGDGRWDNAFNWSGDISPLPGDNIVLDNSIVTGNYTVTLPSGTTAVTISSLRITPLDNNIITLILPPANTAAAAFVANGVGDAVILDKGAVFINSSGGSGTPVSVTSTNYFRINNGGKYIHRTKAGHTTNLVSRLSTADGTENGLFEFDVPTAAFTISLTGRTYGTLILSSTTNGKDVTYSGNGVNPLNINGDLQINKGVTFSVGMSANIIVHDNLISAASSVFNIQNLTNNNLVKISGNINASGTITESGSGFPVIELSGSVNQNIFIPGNITDSVTWRINNSSGVTLLTPLTLSYNLDLQNGNIKTGDVNVLTMIDNTSVTGASNASFIEGPMRKMGDDNFIFPVGKGKIFAPVGFSSVGLNADDVFQAEYLRLNPQADFGLNFKPPIDHTSYVEYWKLDKIVGNTNVQAKVTLTVSEYSFAKDMSTLFAARYSETNKDWESNNRDAKIPGPDRLPYVTGTVTSDFVSPYGIFTLATTEPEILNPLPVHLISFKAIKTNSQQSKISWRLAECPSKFITFEVQRSDDKKEFATIESVNGDASTYSYSILDDQSPCTTKYYRLKIIHEDNRISFSPVATMENDVAMMAVNLYPNPVSDKSMIAINTAVAENVCFTVSDIAGKTIAHWKEVVQAGSCVLPLHIPAISNGIYFLNVAGEKSKTTLRFVKR